MFGWLASFGMHSRARSTPTTRWLAVTPRTLVEGLGQLGGVLYLAPGAKGCPFQDNAPFGCLVESADLAPLLATRYVGLTCAITAEGPREWIDCVSGEGEALARIYLLPDTDYLAWDGLFVDATSVDAPARERPDREWLRASRARVLSFTRRRMVGFTVLGARDVLISSLGRGVARDIAVSESVGITV
ncbi:hypothetical protein BJI69_01715 [Luteibacter rhizovicinus DSM 16549]|uniref:Uncharacterized protein n=1 Tax=Luteibacter rhizovicinus DSM 16549 TaxID=1440763 RepID=A0A1L3ENU9_9GAMM|nr:hypothetical protein [Luteibacter rhizovicinus]APG02753.1 hypothetical protein BJI69_01715 [Luteibacter rhizovicinus DSM 16549]